MRGLSLIFIVILISCGRSAVNPPERHDGIPEDAKWSGGSDGGNWFQLMSMPGENMFHIKVYHDYTGELVENANFTLEPNCGIEKLDSADLLDYIDGYDGEAIILNVPKEGKRCVLRPQ